MTRKVLLEATPERRRSVAENGETVRSLLARWAWLTYALAKCVVVLTTAGFAWLALGGILLDVLGLTETFAGGVVAILGFIPTAKLAWAWAFPVRY